MQENLLPPLIIVLWEQLFFNPTANGVTSRLIRSTFSKNKVIWNMAKPTEIQASFTELTPLCKAMGMKVTDVGEGTATITMPYSEELIGDPTTGVIHGGPVSVLLDSASGLAVLVHKENAGSTATIDLRIDYMRPAPSGEDLTAFAEVYHTTRNAAFIRAHAYCDDPEKPVAQATGAFVFTKKVAK